ncbi:methyl-accepting chemotaxis protein [Thauera sp. WH-2]|jgi:methyl-accepting chemotaxis protein|uniref:methyl-accepting chemotaxis protein n=1 Tax=Thauera sp. WH-2 TaxID=3401574 RepID=UPI003AAFFE16
MAKRLTTAARLSLGFGILLVFLVGIGLLGLNRLGTVERMLDRIVQVDWQKTVLANDVIDLVNAQTRDSFLLFHVPESTHPTIRARIAKRIDAISAHLDRIDGLLYLPEGREMLTQIRDKRRSYVSSFQQVSSLLEAGRREDASEHMATHTTPALDELLASIDALIRLQGRILESTGEEAAASYLRSQTQIFVFLALALISSILISVWIVRAVTRPLGGEPEAAKDAVERIARGDLSALIPVREGDTHSLLAALHQMQSSLREMIGTLTANADSVASAAEQLAVASKQLAESSARQSDAATSMASAIDEMTTSIQQVSDNATDARQITVDAGERSDSGNQVIGSTVREMQAIASTVAEAATTIRQVGDGSQQISTVVQVIKEVADQTNLLALNASIEAARAGEQGRGFAVVADEVRKLAERTAKATMDISAMIDTMLSSSDTAMRTTAAAVTQVEDGVKLARAAGDAMRAISDGTQQAVRSVNGIYTALSEQSQASAEIATNVEQIAQMSEENSAATQQAYETARQLRELAAETRTAVRVFSL